MSRCRCHYCGAIFRPRYFLEVMLLPDREWFRLAATDRDRDAAIARARKVRTRWPHQGRVRVRRTIGHPEGTQAHARHVLRDVAA